MTNRKKKKTSTCLDGTGMFSHSELSNLFIDKRIMFVNPLINEMKIKIRGFYLSAILT